MARSLLPHMHTAANQPIRFDRRVLMCFARSLNWLDFGLDAPEIQPINLYANWLAQRRQLPLGEIPAGRGVPLVYDAFGRGASFVAGERAYRERCLGCHGPNGLGGRLPIDGQLPPPLAGPQSFSAAAQYDRTVPPGRLRASQHATGRQPGTAAAERPGKRSMWRPT